MNRKITESEIKSIKEIYSKGALIGDIAREFECDKTTIRYHVGLVDKDHRRINAYWYKYKKEHPTLLKPVGRPKGKNKPIWVEEHFNKPNSLYNEYLQKYLAKEKKKDGLISELYKHKIKTP